MTDIVERLRKATLYTGSGELSDLPDTAADEIERLRGELEPMQKALEVHAGYAAEVERLRPHNRALDKDC